MESKESDYSNGNENVKSIFQEPIAKVKTEADAREEYSIPIPIPTPIPINPNNSNFHESGILNLHSELNFAKNGVYSPCADNNGVNIQLKRV